MISLFYEDCHLGMISLFYEDCHLGVISLFYEDCHLGMREKTINYVQNDSTYLLCNLGFFGIPLRVT
jgi:hypothetical protein